MTGLSLQPAHYEVHVANYSLVLALVLLAGGPVNYLADQRKKYLAAGLVVVSVIALGWGTFEVARSTAKFAPASLIRDKATPVARRLAELDSNSNADPTETRPVVLVTDSVVADYLPTIASNPLLWAPHLYGFAGVTPADEQVRLMKFLYYTGVRFEGVDESRFEKLDPQRKLCFSILVGRDRIHKGLYAGWKPIAPEEYERAERAYSNFVASFDRKMASEPTLAYVVTAAESTVDLSNLDRWYERSGEERRGDYILYRASLRSP